jgi:hypothetical protein
MILSNRCRNIKSSPSLAVMAHQAIAHTIPPPDLTATILLSSAGNAPTACQHQQQQATQPDPRRHTSLHGILHWSPSQQFYDPHATISAAIIILCSLEPTTALAIRTCHRDKHDLLTTTNDTPKRPCNDVIVTISKLPRFLPGN